MYFLLILLASIFNTQSTNPTKSPGVKEYTIDLDLPAVERWKEVFTDKNESFWAIRDYLMNVVKDVQVFGGFFHSQIPKLENYLYKIPKEYADEIRAASEITGVSAGFIFFMNMIAELTTLCTSVVAKNTNGTQFFARNLDFGKLTFDGNKIPLDDYFRNLTVITHFVKNKKPFYSSVTQAGYFGIITAVKNGKFAVSINMRHQITKQVPGLFTLLSWLYLGKTDKGLLTLTIRDVVETANTFEEAVEGLRSRPLLSTVYYTVGSAEPSEGAVIVRRSLDTEVRRMKDPTNRGAPWYILQTNYDEFINAKINKRMAKGYEVMEAMTADNVGFDGLMTAMSTFPVNNEITLYTAVIDIKSNTIVVKLQYYDGAEHAY